VYTSNSNTLRRTENFTTVYNVRLALANRPRRGGGGKDAVLRRGVLSPTGPQVNFLGNAKVTGTKIHT